MKTPMAQTPVDRHAQQMSVRYESPLRGIFEPNLIVSFNNTAAIK